MKDSKKRRAMIIINLMLVVSMIIGFYFGFQSQVADGDFMMGIMFGSLTSLVGLPIWVILFYTILLTEEAD